MTRAGRKVLKDYVDGKILACKAPPGSSDDIVRLAHDAYPVGVASSERVVEGGAGGALAAVAETADGALAGAAIDVNGDREFAAFLDHNTGKSKPVRPEWKFQKKNRKEKQRSGNGVTGYIATFDDDGQLEFGKKGGLKR